MRQNNRFIAIAFHLLGLAALATTASAGCGDPSNVQPPFQFVDPNLMISTGQLTTRAAATKATGPLSLSASPIGMWNLQFISQGNGSHNPPIPDGAIIDFGYTQWHSDGTEIMNSGAHSPASENFCLGVWLRTGLFTYGINHFALNYDATTGALAAKINIRQQITLDPTGDQYSGTFTIDAYDPSSGQHVDHVAGLVMATRVTLDQTMP
jgi:hypothetical protein